MRAAAKGERGGRRSAPLPFRTAFALVRHGIDPFLPDSAVYALHSSVWLPDGEALLLF